MKTWTMAEAKSDFDRGLLRGVGIYLNEVIGQRHFVVSFESALNLDGSGALVDARTATVRKFKSLDSAYSAIYKIGFRAQRFWLSAN